jgi:hypothetical protein
VIAQHVWTFAATYGVTDHLDVNVLVPSFYSVFDAREHLASSQLVTPPGQPPRGSQHGADVAAGSVFVSLGGFNPTLTIMALSLRMARRLARG